MYGLPPLYVPTTTATLEVGLTRCKCVKFNINKACHVDDLSPGNTLGVWISTQHDAQANSSPQTALDVLGQIFPELDRHELPFFLHSARVQSTFTIICADTCSERHSNRQSAFHHCLVSQDISFPEYLHSRSLGDTGSKSQKASSHGDRAVGAQLHRSRPRGRLWRGRGIGKYVRRSLQEAGHQPPHEVRAHVSADLWLSKKWLATNPRPLNTKHIATEDLLLPSSLPPLSYNR